MRGSALTGATSAPWWLTAWPWSTPSGLVGIHVTRAADPYVGPGAPPLTEAEQALVEVRARWHEVEGGYVHLQRTRPRP